MRSRLSFGLSLSFDFDVYISDEATAVGDRAFKAKAQALFKERVGKSSLIMVSHGEGILRDLCQVGIYIKDGQAFWYDDINEAILAYHSDVDEQKETISAEDEHELAVSLEGDPETFSKAQVQELQKRLKEARQHMNGIGQRLHQARHEKWPKDEIRILSQLRQSANDEVTKFTTIINKTFHGSRRNCKAKIHQANLSVRSFNILLAKAERESWDSKEIETIKKSLEIAYAEKVKAEAILQDLDGFE
jgi:capsular polysaccharide transport system ATP-binding protein